MSCLGDRLAELADGRLDPVAADRALAHVAGCPSCQHELAAQRRIHRLLAVSPAPEPSESFLARLAAAPDQIASGGRARSDVPPDRPRSRRDGTGPGRPARHRRRLAVAAGGLAVVAVAMTWGGSAIAMISPPSTPGLTLVVPAVDRYTAEHTASTDLLPLTTPGSSIALVSYGTSSLPTTPGDRAAVRLRVS